MISKKCRYCRFFKYYPHQLMDDRGLDEKDGYCKLMDSDGLVLSCNFDSISKQFACKFYDEKVVICIYDCNIESCPKHPLNPDGIS